MTNFALGFFLFCDMVPAPGLVEWRPRIPAAHEISSRPHSFLWQEGRDEEKELKFILMITFVKIEKKYKYYSADKGQSHR